MCLYITSEKIKRLKNKVVDGKITCYKMFQINGNGLYTPYYRMYMTPGWNKAIGETLGGYEYYKDDKAYNTIEGGAIHVFTNYKEAKKEALSMGCKLIKVTCLAKDFIAEGTESEACFTKIWISKSEYDRVTK